MRLYQQNRPPSIPSLVRGICEGLSYQQFANWGGLDSLEGLRHQWCWSRNYQPIYDNYGINNTNAKNTQIIFGLQFYINLFNALYISSDSARTGCTPSGNDRNNRGFCNKSSSNRTATPTSVDFRINLPNPCFNTSAAIGS